MKLADLKAILNEMPYQHDGKMPRENFTSTFISDEALSREYALLGFFEIGDEMVELHILVADVPCVKGTVKAVHPEDGRQSNRIVFSLRFKHGHTLVNTIHIDETKILQVDKVSVDREFGDQGLASFAYSRLALRGFIILSDNAQFTDGKMLWKKMSERAHLRNYKIYVLDDEYGFITKDGEPLVYDGKNIDDAKIWSSGDNFDGFHKLLVMKA